MDQKESEDCVWELKQLKKVLSGLNYNADIDECAKKLEKVVFILQEKEVEDFIWEMKQLKSIVQKLQN